MEELECKMQQTAYCTIFLYTLPRPQQSSVRTIQQMFGLSDFRNAAKKIPP